LEVSFLFFGSIWCLRFDVCIVIESLSFELVLQFEYGRKQCDYFTGEEKEQGERNWEGTNKPISSSSIEMLEIFFFRFCFFNWIALILAILGFEEEASTAH